MSDNLNLWNSVAAVPAAARKKITGRDYGGDSPDPYYLYKVATERWGPHGLGWGWDIVEHGVRPVPGEADTIVWVRLRLWYQEPTEEVRGTVEHVGETRANYVKQTGGAKVDEDALKKAVTDASTKCLSILGFAADIFTGKWKDSKFGGAPEAPATAEPPIRQAPKKPGADWWDE